MSNLLTLTIPIVVNYCEKIIQKDKANVEISLTITKQGSAP